MAVSAISIVAGSLAAATSTAAPTGTPAFDAMWRAGLVVLTTLAAARCRRWSLVVGAGLVTLGAAGWWSTAGLAALGLTFLLAWEDRRSRIAGAGAGALVGLAALHLGWPRPTFSTAVLGAVAMGLIWASGYRTSSRRVRRRVLIGVVAFGIVVVFGLVGAVVFGLTQRSNVDAAIDDALSAVDGMGASTTDASTAGFRSATERLDRVVDAADAPWMVPARAIPVLGANVHSVRESAAAGSDLTAAAEQLSSRVDYDRLQLDGGGIDLAAMAGFEQPLGVAERALIGAEESLADARSPLVLPLVARRMDDLHDRVAQASEDATTARLAVTTAPDLLGADGPRRYLLLLGNPAEARDLGGHLGNWAEIVADGGRIDVVRVGAPYDLFAPNGPGRPLLPDASAYPRSLVEMNPTRFAQNWGASPDLPTVARLAAELYPQTVGGAPIDGVIYADPTAFAAALGITGPVSVPGTDLTLDAAGAAEFLQRGQYAMFETETQGDRVVTDLVELALDRLLEGQLPAPRAVADAFGPTVDSGHLRFYSLHDSDLPLLERLHLDGAVDAPAGDDVLAVITRNANPSKIDSYLTRSIDDRVTWDPSTGDVRSQVVVTLTNTAPATGLPAVVALPPPGGAPGTNRTELAVLTPLAAAGATIDGAATAVGTRDDVDGLQRHTLQLDLAPGQTRTVVFDLEGRLDGPDYRLHWIGQPLANPDEAELVIRSTGAPFVGGAREGKVILSGDQEQLTGGGRSITLRTEQ